MAETTKKTKRTTAKKITTTTSKRAATGTRTTAASAARKPRVSRTTKAAADSTAAVVRTGGSLVIVESPAKARTLHKYLGKGFKIEASVGHIKDLPTSKLGVEIDKDFEPQYIVMKGKERVIDKITAAAQKVDTIYLAPDPDREGEAIAWHIASELHSHGINVPIHRATFNEITRRAVTEAIAHPQELNEQLFEAQQARRILDRLVGYQISPLLWKKVTRGLSAGRVQSVAVRLIVEREREIRAFTAEEYWTIEALVAAKAPPPFEMRLLQIDGRKPDFKSGAQACQVLERLGADNACESFVKKGEEGTETLKRFSAAPGQTWTVSNVEKKDVKRHPAPPFITSTLQQEAGRKLGFSASRTMSIAQRLYEGVELGEEGMTALITYMRTDSTRVSNDALEAVRGHIDKTYGAEYVPADPNFYKSRKGAQDAHEAVRPTYMEWPPERVSSFLDRDQLRLYELIWKRFVASQMADAILEQTRIDSLPTEGIVFTATGLVTKFPGYLAIYEEGRDDGDGADDKADKLPPVKPGDSLAVRELRGSQHFTQPPPRYTEASLVKELEKRGIGRPSTYASIVSVIQDKKYAEKDDQRRFHSTQLGETVTDLLVESFPEVLDVSFTAQMEEKLDEVEDGTQNWKTLLHDFYGGFKERLDAATENMRKLKGEAEETDILCDKCGQANMVIKWGRNGKFLACPKYPECKNTREYSVEGGQAKPVEVEETDEVCDNCGKHLIVKSGRHGRFLACPGYPECKTVKPFKTGVKCPECGEGDLVERSSRNGKLFFSCSKYPACKFAMWNRPVAQPCPKCGSPYMQLKVAARKRTLLCPNAECKHSEALPDEGPAASDEA